MSLFDHPLVPALGWTLLHSLWQGLLVAGATTLLLRVARGATPGTRHALAGIGLFLCFLGPALTLAHLWPAEAALPAPLASSLASLAPPAGVAGSLAPAGPTLADRIRPALPWIVAAWSLGALVALTRLAAGWAWLHRLRRRALPASPDWEARLARLARRMGLRRVPGLRLCGTLGGPVVQGWWRPVILMPPALLLNLDAGLLEALLAHELAHLRRHDPLVNLIQSLCETLLFYHPAVWWLSARVRQTREEACDHLAATAIGEPRRLALALAELDRFQLPAPALGAHQGDLMTRIRRLLQPPPPRPLLGGALPAVLTAILLAPFTAHGAPPAPEPAPAPILVAPDRLAEVDALAKEHGLDPHLLRAMAWAESRFDPAARSPRGAMGLLQVMPETARKYGATRMDDPADVAAAGARYLKALLARYPGDVAKAVAAYNCGEEALDAGRITEEATRYRALVLRLYQARAIQPEPARSPSAAEAPKAGPRSFLWARKADRLTLKGSLTRPELQQWLADHWNTLFVEDAEDRRVEQGLKPLRTGEKPALHLDLTDAAPRDLMTLLTRDGWLPDPGTAAWKAQMPAATLSGHLKRNPDGTLDLRFEVVALGGYDLVIQNASGAEIGQIISGSQASETPVLRDRSLPRVRLEAHQGALRIRATEHGTGRWGETAVPFEGTETTCWIRIDQPAR
ncbi:MAG: Regulatory protein BlaR1 [Acidobacteria bacterium ADurb.Bin340]|nr:MAG: Regulatory protein BlaR1 [Acidobacteria bacterium ADurb.Bin340]